MLARLRIATGLMLFCAAVQVGAETPPVAEILGKKITLTDLDVGMPANLLKPANADAMLKFRQERLRGLVWSAVFDDYAKQRRIEPTPAEIESHIRHHRKFREEDRTRREKERAALAEELKSPELTETRRRQAQQHLKSLNYIQETDARLETERRDPARAQMWQEAERRVAEHWVKRWKLNQTLYREFGGRIVFQQAGWEPIDAYRKLLDQYVAKKAFVVHDPSLREAVYSYFQHNFVYADATKAKFYFEKPYWERTPAELKAAGF